MKSKLLVVHLLERVLYAPHIRAQVVKFVTVHGETYFSAYPLDGRNR